MKIAIYGGSFNPPHVCHVLVATWTLSTCRVDRVWVVPTYRHAFGKDLAPFDARCELARRAMRPLGDAVEVSDVEAKLGQESRTIDTMNYLTQAYPSHTFSLVIGADILLERHKWKRFDELERRFAFHVVGRGGIEVPGFEFAIEMPNVSSTELRTRLAARDLPYCRERVPDAALEYILDEGLYLSGRSK